MNSKVSQRKVRLAAMIPVAAGLASAVLLAACASPAPSQSGAPGGLLAGSSSDYQANLAYSQCMRTHGIADYPDPKSNGGFLIQSRPGEASTVNGVPVDISSPQFIAADSTCQRLKPNGGHPTSAQLAQLLRNGVKYSQCMRAHGVAGFPDPTVSNDRVNFNIQVGGPGALDPNSPVYQAATRTCQAGLIPSAS